MSQKLSLEQIVNCGVAETKATEIWPQIDRWLSLAAIECWQNLVRYILNKEEFPFALHQLLYETTFSDWDDRSGPPPAWVPSRSQIGTTNIAALMEELKINSYSELHTRSIENRAEFWQVAIERLNIRFREKYTEILNLDSGIESPQWLVGARFNIVESCFSAPPNDPAIIFQPDRGSLCTITYGELHALTNRVANGLLDAGFGVGDAIAIYMPMTVESVAIYLGIVKAGAVVVSIADSFAAPEIATRLHISKAKGIFTRDYLKRAGKQLPLYAKVVEADAPKAIVLSSDPASGMQLRPGDLNWQDFLSKNDRFEAAIATPSAHINILFSSGTTGEPKAIPWTQTTPLKCAMDAHFHHDIHPKEVIAWPSNLGWMMGPWLIYASLINRSTMALYYGAPTERGFGEFIRDAGVNILGVVPTLVSAWKASECMRGLDWSAIKAFSSTGECSNPRDMLFLMSRAGYKPIIEYCGGTEIGGAYITGTLVQPCAPATFTTPALGLDLIVLDEDGSLASQGECCIIPPAIGLSVELLNKDHHRIYYAGVPSPLRRHGDRIECLPNGYYRARGRVDDTMNLGGIKVSSAEIEQVLNAVEGIREAAAIAVSPRAGGPSQLVVYAVAKTPTGGATKALQSSLQAAIARHLNPLFKIADLVIVETLPRTASNKLMRRVLRDSYSG